MAALSTNQQVTQQARHYLAVANDKFKLASGQIGRGDTMVRPKTLSKLAAEQLCHLARLLGNAQQRPV